MWTQSILVKRVPRKKFYFKTFVCYDINIKILFKILYSRAKRSNLCCVSSTYNFLVLYIQHSLFEIYQITKTNLINNVFSDVIRFFFFIFFSGGSQKQETSQNTPLISIKKNKTKFIFRFKIIKILVYHKFIEFFFIKLIKN